MKNLFLISLLLNSTIIIANDCIIVSVDASNDNANLVFLGRVFQVNDTAYHIKIIESFKGISGDSIIGIINDDSIVPKNGEIWLFLGEKTNAGAFFSHYCNGSRSFQLPLGMMPPPPKPGTFTTSTELDLYYQLVNNTALSQLYFDIERLRSMKLGAHIEHLQNDFKKLSESYQNLEGQISFIRMFNWLLFGALVIIMLVSITTLRKHL